MNVNKILIAGRLGRDPEVKNLSSGSTLCTLSPAVSESFVNREGQKQERTEWFTVKIFGKIAEAAAKNLSKGQLVYVEGKLQTESWEDKDGNKKYKTVVMAYNVQWQPKKQQGNPNQTNFGNADGEMPF